jgi:hypothetical protein
LLDVPDLARIWLEDPQPLITSMDKIYTETKAKSKPFEIRTELSLIVPVHPKLYTCSRRIYGTKAT